MQMISCGDINISLAKGSSRIVSWYFFNTLCKEIQRARGRKDACFPKDRTTARSRVRHKPGDGTGRARGVRSTECRKKGSDGQGDLIILELVMCQAPQGTLPSSHMLLLVRHFQRYKVLVPMITQQEQPLNLPLMALNVILA